MAASKSPQPAPPTLAARSEQASLTRRELLSGSAGIGAAALLRGPVGAQSRRVLVVGAGIAGIAAANALEADGFDVTILESRNRVGGRIWTDRSWGVPLDRGASWIHGAASPNPIWALRNRHGLRTLPTDYDDIAVYDVNGRRVSTSQLDEDFAAYRQIFRQARRWGRQRFVDSSLLAGIQATGGLEDMTSYDRRALDFQLNWNVEQDYGADASDLSNLWFDQDTWLGGRRDVLMRDGYGELVDLLAEDLDIRLNSPVLSVTVFASGVSLQTVNAVHRGAFAVITVPLGVLQAERITFLPPLPPRKVGALERLAMGTLNKLFLRFRRRFWDESEWFGYQANTRGYWALWQDLERATGEPILVAFNAGAYGSAVELMTNQAAVAEAMRVLRTIYGSAVPNPDRSLLTRWNADPHALGAYSHIPPGATGADYRILASPVRGRLFWAGEATIPRYPQTVAGAYLSGQRAAEQILEVGA